MIFYTLFMTFHTLVMIPERGSQTVFFLAILDLGDYSWGTSPVTGNTEDPVSGRRQLVDYCGDRQSGVSWLLQLGGYTWETARLLQ